MTEPTTPTGKWLMDGTVDVWYERGVGWHLTAASMAADIIAIEQEAAAPWKHELGNVAIDRERERDEARADAARLAEALRRNATLSDEGNCWCRKHQDDYKTHLDACDDARKALRLHDEVSDDPPR